MPSRKQMPANLAGSVGTHAPTAFAAEVADRVSDVERDARSEAQIRTISVFRLAAHPLQPAERHSTENVAELKLSISRLGLLDPPLVWRRVDGSYVILAGHRRCHAVKLLVAEEGRDPRIRVHVLDGISEADALRIIAAEYCHRREYSTLHTARIVGAAHETLKSQTGDDVPLRELAAVLPLERTVLGQYLTIYQAMLDPRLSDLVRGADKAPKSVLYKALKHADVQARASALQALQPNPSQPSAAPVAPARSRRQTSAVKRRKRGRGFDLAVQVRPTMSSREATEVKQALRQAVADVDVLFPDDPTT